MLIVVVKQKTTGLSFEGLACAVKCFTFLTQLSSVIHPDGLTMVKSVECTLCLLTVLVRCF